MTPELSSTVSASEAKNDFARILERVIRGGTVTITKHNAAKAVILPMEEYESLTRERRASLAAFKKRYDEMFQSMQTPEWRAAAMSAFSATPEELGRVAVEAARNSDK